MTCFELQLPLAMFKLLCYTEKLLQMFEHIYHLWSYLNTAKL